MSGLLHPGPDEEAVRSWPTRCPLGPEPSLAEQRQVFDAWMNGARYAGVDVEFIPLYVVNHILGRG